MLKLGVVIAAVVGFCWLGAALLGGLFKLVFGLLGVVFGGLAGLFTVGVVGVVVASLVMLALLPLLLPVLFVAGLVWLTVHAAQPRGQVTASR
jgi:hypothetical protein